VQEEGAIWIENISNGEIIEKIEIEDLCKLGSLEK
jgi:hypothetical protein